MNYHKTALFALIIFVAASCSRTQLSPEEADRSMKVLNSNLMNLLTSGSEKPDYKAIAFLLSQTNVPLPFVRKPNPTALDTAVYRITTYRGIYNWNPKSKTFSKDQTSDEVVLNFPLETSTNDASLILSKYRSMPYSSRPDFPVKLEAVLKTGGKVLASIHHRATIADQLPETVSSEIDGSDYTIRFDLNRTRSSKTGNLTIDFSFKTKGIRVISGTMDADIEYGRKGYFFRFIQFSMKLIDHQIDGHINYSAIDPTATDYIRSFNSNSEIIIREGRNKVGKIVLNKVENNELLDYFVLFSGGKEILLSEYIPVLKKLLNLKY